MATAFKVGDVVRIKATEPVKIKSIAGGYVMLDCPGPVGWLPVPAAFIEHVPSMAEAVDGKPVYRQLQPGDVVTLKSGGPKMVIESLDDEEAHCVYFADGCHYDVLSAAALQLAG